MHTTNVRHLFAAFAAALSLFGCGGGTVAELNAGDSAAPATSATAATTSAPLRTAALRQPLKQFAPGTVQLRGVNLAGAEFTANNLPGGYGRDYTYPTTAEIDYFKSKGMNVIRIPFLWERMQPTLNAALYTTELNRLKNIAAYATDAGMTVILDPHNYARYRGSVIGSAAVSSSAFADFWSRMAAAFKSNDRVIFGLMNEPHDMATETWLGAANAAIAAIRSAGALNLVAVPGNAWSGAWTWQQSWYGSPNATVMLGVQDPANNYVYDVHQYFDSDSTGTSDQCASDTAGTDRLRDFTTWLRNHGKRAILGEFAVGANATCANALAGALQAMHDNADVWLGWCWWAAGPWWGSYMFSIEPSGRTDKPQMAMLAPYLDGSSQCASSPNDTVSVDAENQGFPLAEQLRPDIYVPGTATTRDYCIGDTAIARIRTYGANWVGVLLQPIDGMQRGDVVIRMPDGSQQNMGSMYNFITAPAR